MELSHLNEQFSKLYPDVGTPFHCRIPGRVNLMGEHLDYNGLPVLPMAIDRAIYLAFAPMAGPTFLLANMEERFPGVNFENGATIDPSAAGAWENYAKAAVTGLNQHFSVSEFRGMAVLVGSDLPGSAGLSSSSALVVGFGMAYLAALGYTLDADISRLEFAAVMAEAEHYVGTAGGGMDPTVILHGEAGCATRINFIPFQVDLVPLPVDVEFLICDSLVVANKSGDAMAKYNAGPATCSLMTALVDRHLKETFGEEFAIDCLGDLWFGPLCFNKSEVEELLDTVFHESYVSPEDIAARLDLSMAVLKKSWLAAIPFGKEGLPLKARARHILSEYYRVEEGRDALLAKDTVTFGQCMSASHRSCAVDYGISTPELDTLCAILEGAGSLGARLTGAGFGGAVVAMVPAKRSDAILTHVAEAYYGGRSGYCTNVSSFRSTASKGAVYIS